MLRESMRKLLRGKYSRTRLRIDPLETSVSLEELQADGDPSESKSSRVFRKTFIEKFKTFSREVEILSLGNANFDESWLETLGREGMGLSFGVIAGIIGLLGGLSILSAPVTAGVSIGVAVLGVICVVAFYKYRNYVKGQWFERASMTLQRDDLDQEIRTVARLLADLYRVQLGSCTVKDAAVLAESCMKAISEEALKNKRFSMDELLDVSSLQVVLMRSLSKVPKHKLDMNLITNKKFNTRGLIGHSAYYCRETDEFYCSPQSKSAKYGVLFFDKKTDLEGYEAILTSTLRKGEKWKFSKMKLHEVNALKHSSMFKAYQNDRVYNASCAEPEKVDTTILTVVR